MGDFVASISVVPASGSDEEQRAAVLNVLRRFPRPSDRGDRREILAALGLLDRLPQLFTQN